MLSVPPPLQHPSGRWGADGFVIWLSAFVQLQLLLLALERKTVTQRKTNHLEAKALRFCTAFLILKGCGHSLVLSLFSTQGKYVAQKRLVQAVPAVQEWEQQQGPDLLPQG